MDNKFKRFGFKIQKGVDEKTLAAYQSIKIYCTKIDNETLLLSNSGGGDFSLYLQDRFFYFGIDNETKRVSSFNGELTHFKINNADLRLPETVKNAVLELDTVENLVAGTGSYIEFNTKKICYDKDKKILQIGDIDLNKPVIRFLGNGFAQIQGGRLAGLLFSEIEL